MKYIKEKGFSLIELMIVLLMVALVGGGVAITANSASSAKKQLYKTGEKLFAQMNFALDEALIQQRLIGFRVDDSEHEKPNYSWHYYDNKRWHPLKEPLSTFSLPEGIFAEIVVEDEIVETLLEETLNNLSEEEVLPPAIVFYPNGDISEFSLELVLKDGQEETDKFRIYIDERGQLTHTLISKSSSDENK